MTFSKRKILSGILLLVLLISIPVGMYLVKQAQTGRSRASEGAQDRDRSRIKKVGTYFFYWYDAPRNPNSDIFAYTPYGLRLGEGVDYSANSLDWYKQEIKDMEYAGIDYIFPISMGQVPQTGNGGFIYLRGDPFGDPVHRYMPHSSLMNHSNVEEGNLVKAIRQTQSKMKVGLFDDMTSLSTEYNDLRDDGQINGSNYCGGSDWFNNRSKTGDTYQYENPCKVYNIALPSDDAFNIQYTRKMKNFFQGIPRDLWATHNGLPVDQGGRPIVMFYPPITPISFQGPQILSEQGLKKYAIKVHFKRMKDAFKNDFGVEPFFISNYWGDLNDPEFEGVFDSHIGWMAVLGGGRTKNNQTNYIAGAISSGQNAEKLDENFKRLYNYNNIYSYQPRSKPVCKDPDKESDRQYIDSNAPLDLNNPAHINRSCADFPQDAIDTHLKDSFNLVTNIYGPDSGRPIDLLIVETWNELIEGSGIMRAKNWPKVDSPGNREFSPSNKSEDTVMMTSLRNLLGFSPTLPPERVVTPPASPGTSATPGANTIQDIINLFGGSGSGDQNGDGKINELDFGAVYSR